MEFKAPSLERISGSHLRINRNIMEFKVLLRVFGAGHAKN